MSEHTVVCLFPGQGAYYQGVGTELEGYAPRFRDTVAIIDEEAGRLLGIASSPVLFSSTPPSAEQLLAEQPEVLQLAMYAIAVTVYEEIKERGVKADILCGHSFGELAALVCGGAFSIRQGAELVCHRAQALRELPGDPGYMAALGIGTGRARDLVRVTGEDRCAVAVENHDSQTVLSGTSEAMDAVVRIAEILNIQVKRLVSAHAFHCPAVMKPVAEAYADRTRHIYTRPLETRVYSPILGRDYTEDDIKTECLAQHLYKPVRFSEAIQQLYTGGSRLFIECGALTTMTTLVKTALKDPLAAVIPVLDPSQNGASFSNALRMLEAADVIQTGAGKSLREYLLPEATPAEFKAFWHGYGPGLLRDIQQKFDAAVRVQESRREQPPAESAAPSVSDRDTLFTELAKLYATVLEYPPEVFEEQIDLEAELGVDSVKQMELLSRIQEQYRIPPLPDDFRLSDYTTLGKVTDLVLEGLQVSDE